MDLNKKAAAKILREKHVKPGEKLGGSAQRTRLLAYGYMRNRPYGTMERTTNGDSHCAIGKKTYYYGLAYSISNYLRKYVLTETESKEDLEGWLAVSINKNELTKSILEWIEVHTNREG